MKPRVCFVVDSGTDVRLADGLAEGTSLRILARRLPSGREISQSSRHELNVEIGPGGHAAFALHVLRRLIGLRREIDVVVVQGYGPTAAFANLAGRLTGLPVLMLVCSPMEAYHRCRRTSGTGRPFRRVEYLAIRLFSRLNAWLGRAYVVLSPYLASVVRAHGGKNSVDVIPVYGVDRRSSGRPPNRKLRCDLALGCQTTGRSCSSAAASRRKRTPRPCFGRCRRWPPPAVRFACCT